MSSAAQEGRPNEKGEQYPTGPEAIAFALGEVTGKVNNLRADIQEWKGELRGSIAKEGAKVETQLADHEARLDAIEKWHIKITTLMGAAGAIVGWLGQWVIHNVHL